TRAVNVIDLKRSKNHQAIYTGLSHGSSAVNTLVVRSFDARKIQGGVSGWMRQEFHELNYLDTITRLRYEGSL
ncbi:hypothetical protein FA15DRAFT_546778, partial [Coprinopsis marcescibilis]